MIRTSCSPAKNVVSLMLLIGVLPVTKCGPNLFSPTHRASEKL